MTDFCISIPIHLHLNFCAALINKRASPHPKSIIISRFVGDAISKNPLIQLSEHGTYGESLSSSLKSIPCSRRLVSIKFSNLFLRAALINICLNFDNISLLLSSLISSSSFLFSSAFFSSVCFSCDMVESYKQFVSSTTNSS